MSIKVRSKVFRFLKIEEYPNLKKTVIEHFSVYNDKKKFVENTSVETVENAKFACGMFRFTKV